MRIVASSNPVMYEDPSGYKQEHTINRHIGTRKQD